MSETTAELFLSFSRDRLQFLASRIIDCVGRLSNDQLWARGSANENSIGNLVLHLCGNVHQRIVSGVGGETDVRDRDSEFAARGGLDGRELQRRLETTIKKATEVIRTCTNQPTLRNNRCSESAKDRDRGDLRSGRTLCTAYRPNHLRDQDANGDRPGILQTLEPASRHPVNSSCGKCRSRGVTISPLSQSSPKQSVASVRLLFTASALPLMAGASGLDQRLRTGVLHRSIFRVFLLRNHERLVLLAEHFLRITGQDGKSGPVARLDIASKQPSGTTLTM